MALDTNPEKKLSILIIEDDIAAYEEFEKCVNDHHNVHISGITNSSTEALELVKNTLPDAIILDLELHHGSGNGLQFLVDYANLKLPYRSYILVTTNNSSRVTYETARNLGADFIMSKHEKDYSVKSVINFLLTIYPTLLSMRKISIPVTQIEETPSKKQHRITQLITRELDLIGINRKNIGYQYLIETILLTYENPDINAAAFLGQKYHKQDLSIERAMQYAISRAWRTAPIEDLQTYYTAKTHSCRGVPTLSEFVFYYVGLIKTHEKE